MLADDASGSVVNELGKGDVNPISYSAYGHRSAEHTVSTRLGYNGEVKEMQTGCYLLGNGYRAFNPVLMKFHSPDSLSPFGKGGLNGYAYCNGDPVNRTDPTGNVGIFRRLLNFVGLKKSSAPRAPANQRPVSTSPVVTTRAQPPLSTNQSGTSEPAQSNAILPPYSRNGTSGGSSGTPRLPNYDEDKVIVKNSAQYLKNEELKQNIEAGNVFSRKEDQQAAIAKINKKQRDIRRTEDRLLNERPPRTRADIEAEQARNRAVLQLRINPRR
jgi:RHS repeat-associated protein